MSVRWPVGLLVCALGSVTPLQLFAQTATPAPVIRGALPPTGHRFAHHKKVVATYDSVADSTHLAVVTHKGKYFLTTQRPRLTWMVGYAGRAPGPQPPVVVVLEFRTQSPQVALDSRLVMSFAGGRRLEVASGGAFSDPGALTWSHFMRFSVPTAALAEGLAGDEVSVTVGGITERFQPDQVNALRDLIERAGGWPAIQATPGGN